MVIYYNLETKQITRTEDNTMTPILPFNATFEEQKAHYKSIGEDFIGLPYEMGSYVYSFKLGFDVDGNFVGLQSK